MDEEGKIDPVRYIQHSKMKRANFLYHMNNLFPGSSSSLSSRNSSAAMNRMMMASMMNDSSSGGMLANSSDLMNNNSLPSIGRNNSLPMSLPTRVGDFARTGVVPPRMFGSMGLGSGGMELEQQLLMMQMQHNSNRIVSGASSLATSPALNSSPEMMAAAAMGRSQKPQGGVLNQDEYDAAEALLFGMGRACPSNKAAAEGRNDEETTTVKSTEKKKKNTPKKATSPKKRKAKMSPKKKNTPKKKTAEGDDAVRSKPPLKKRNKILELYPECFN
ncbi:MAG: hypothetical protein SGARI_003020 [Bacillariaceae sp.]